MPEPSSRSISALEPNGLAQTKVGNGVFLVGVDSFALTYVRKAMKDEMRHRNQLYD
jgi:uncharacterized protein YaaQ